ncbi:MAG: FkbM family methyltransferase [Planctomycetota bacterium]|jgi:FkbM family methyltransferase|nr:FkbM family methyltransferase [Planctomycetota bacterium]MDP7130425.1 FkbM family methyltransferase [Planctomycetota bacterium]MDP7249365.1 FkbM family methyltransferase [Planctomycetota bacterium]
MRYFNLVKNLSNWQTYLAVKSGLNREDPLMFETRAGIRFEVPRRLLHTFKEIFMDEDYMTGLGRPVPDGAAVIDVGANAGYFSMFAASRFKGSRVIAFEPIPVNFEQLQKNIAFSNSTRITGIQKAVYRETGEISLSYDPTDSFTTSATIFDKDQEPDSIQVATTTLMDVFEGFEIDRCDLLKLDCEGAEYDILYNSPDCFHRIQQIAMEVHEGPEPDQNLEAIDGFLKENGYSTRSLYNRMLWAWR